MSVQEIAKGNNFTAVNIGKFDNLNQHVFKGSAGEMKGKVFLGYDNLGLTGSEISYGVIPPGVQLPFFHLHNVNEEVYLIIKGKGEYQVDDKVFPIEEGSIVRVGTGASRCYKNTGTEPLVIICVQTKQYEKQIPIMQDCEFPQTEPKFSK